MLPAKGLKFLIDGVEVALLRIELVAEPFQQLLVPLVAGVADSLQQFLVAPGAAAVLGRTGPLARYAARIADAGLGRQRLLDLDDVSPVVPEVIDVGKLLVPPGHDLAQLRPPLVLVL